MCTALSLKTKDRYFGRNLDIDRSYGEQTATLLLRSKACSINEKIIFSAP